MQTLKQLTDAKTIPCCEIKDSPRCPWRGVLLDESRHFFGRETVKALLDEMARYKLNRFHWHLTDDQGWGVKYEPMCHKEVKGFRGHRLHVRFSLRGRLGI
ncbi:MAG: family 20 glycosylhydrolase [Kiritimatiellae bacterium]|nr:family 20 glycosylhydrolase [Kiritimatiellia bacterium]